MDELEKTLDRVLSDPAEMEKLSRLAGQLFGGEPSGTPAKQESGGAPELSGLAKTLGGLMGGGGKSDKAALLNALSPYLRSDRRDKLQKAMRLARAARVAGAALHEFGGEGSAL